jgi:hypothetical protein
MFIPYVIDNQTHTMREVLTALLKAREGRCLDIATAYFNVGGFDLIKEGLLKLGNLRLILGSEPTVGRHLGMEPEPDAVNGLIRRDLEELPFSEKTLRSDRQETVIEDILRSYREQEAIKVAPRAVEPIQQTVATLLQNYMNHPDVERPRTIAAIKSLSGPMLAVQVKALRKTFKQFQADGDITKFLEDVEKVSSETETADQSPPPSTAPSKMIGRDDLTLICFDVISG